MFTFLKSIKFDSFSWRISSYPLISIMRYLFILSRYCSVLFSTNTNSIFDCFVWNSSAAIHLYRFNSTLISDHCVSCMITQWEDYQRFQFYSHLWYEMHTTAESGILPASCDRCCDQRMLLVSLVSWLIFYSQFLNVRIESFFNYSLWLVYS